jgi:hypothetical protein
MNKTAMDLIEVAQTDKLGNAGRESCSLTTLFKQKNLVLLWAWPVSQRECSMRIPNLQKVNGPPIY